MKAPLGYYTAEEWCDVFYSSFCDLAVNMHHEGDLSKEDIKSTGETLALLLPMVMSEAAKSDPWKEKVSKFEHEINAL